VQTLTAIVFVWDGESAGMIVDIRQMGSPLPNQLVVGGSVCQLGGNVVLVGTYFINVLLFGNAGGAGGIVGLLGGTLTWIGGGLVVVGGAINLWGAGKLAFVGTCPSIVLCGQ
jgi:hypothetical protein